MIARSKTLWLLSGSAMLLVIVAFLIDERTLDIHLHDTYYIIAYSHVYILFALIIMVIALVYRLLFYRLMSIKLTWLHIILSLLVIFLFSIYPFLPESTPRRYIDFSNWSNPYDNLIGKIRWFIFIFLLAQLFFFINIIGGLIRGRQ